jgi:hypothetical protein
VKAKKIKLKLWNEFYFLGRSAAAPPAHQRNTIGRTLPGAPGQSARTAVSDAGVGYRTLTAAG